jgi:hypothetical protein
MDGFNEKKWFIYLGDHHEGPFSLDEIQSKLGQSEVTASNYVWCEGMPDWKVMTEVTEFEPLLNVAGPKPPSPQSVEVPASPLSLVPAPEAALSVEPASAPAPQEKQVIAALSSVPSGNGAAAVAPLSLELDTMTRPAATSSAPRKRTPASGPKSRSIFKSLLVAAVVAVVLLAGLRFGASHGADSPGLQAFNQTLTDAIQPAMLSLTRSVPALSKWISPIPSLRDVDPADYEELRQAAATPLEREGARVAVALSNADLAAPAFYVAGNLPDGATFDVTIEGTPDTLLNQLAVVAQGKATLTRKMGRSEPLRFNGQALPRGQYTVYATESEQGQSPEAQATLAAVPPVSAQVPAALPRGLKLLVSKRYFLGGAKDATYEARLKEYHDKLREKAQTELAEVKQFGSTLEAQLQQTEQGFRQANAKRSRGKPTPAARKGWNGFHGGWAKLQAQLQASWEKWPAATDSVEAQKKFNDEVFYGPLYRAVRSLGESVSKLHELQHSLMEGKADARAAEIQLPTLVSECQTALAAAKAKVDQAEKLAPTANGMPRREGL